MKNKQSLLPLCFFACCSVSAFAACDMSVVNVGGVPRFAIDGKPVAATAVMPSPAGKPGAAIDTLKAFRAAGVRSISSCSVLFWTWGVSKSHM